jgi:hypothetical protein
VAPKRDDGDEKDTIRRVNKKAEAKDR